MSRLILGGVALAAGFAAVTLLPLGSGNPDVPFTLLSAAMLATSIVPLATSLQGSGWQRFRVWFALLFLNLASVSIEGTLFAP